MAKQNSNKTSLFLAAGSFFTVLCLVGSSQLFAVAAPYRSANCSHKMPSGFLKTLRLDGSTGVRTKPGTLLAIGKAYPGNLLCQPRK